MLADIDERKGHEVTDAIVAQGGTAAFTCVDAADEQSVTEAIAATVEKFARLQVLVNTAGAGDLGSAPGEAWHDFIDLYLKGTYYACLHAVDEIEKAGGGSIVNVASIAGVTGSVSADVAGTGYAAAKHGVIGLTRTMALAYAKRSIRVNAVCPGYVKTGITEFLYANPETSRRLISEDLRVPMDRWGEPHRNWIRRGISRFRCCIIHNWPTDHRGRRLHGPLGKWPARLERRIIYGCAFGSSEP